MAVDPKDYLKWGYPSFCVQEAGPEITLRFNLIGKIYVETHDHKWPELREPTQKMKVRVQEMGLNQKFDFNWV